MPAEDELAFPQVPEAKPEDNEDISWALSTAEAMWARGDHVEGIKWVRKAAEAASEVENDERALELAKAASDLATLIARRSAIAQGEAPGSSVEPRSSAHPPSAPPNTARMPGSPSMPAPAPAPPAPAPPAPPASGRPAPSVRPAVHSKSSPPRSMPPSPIPLPSRASTAPKAPAPPPSSAPAVAQRAAPRPLATADARQGPQAGRGILSNRPSSDAAKTTKTRRRSRDNLDTEARAAGVLETAPQTAVDGQLADRVLGETIEVAAIGGHVMEVPAAHPYVSPPRSGRPDPDPTIVTTLKDLVASERQKSAAEWDASPTQDLTGDDMDSISNGDRKTTAFGVPAIVAAAPPPPAIVRGPAATLHDPQIQTSQAVRVVVWRDANGVHVAPAGTVVSSITIDAVLVVLEPSADLTAWLSHRER